MNRHVLISHFATTVKSYTLLLIVVLTSTIGQAQTLDLTPFSPTSNDMFLCQYTYSGTGTSLYTLAVNNEPLTITQIGSTSPAVIKINAIGYNPIDNFIYGINQHNKHLFKIGAGFVYQDLGLVPNLPIGTNNYFAGDIDDAGNYYVKGNNSSIFKIDMNVSPLTAVRINLSVNITTFDFAFNKSDGLLYGVSNNSNKLYTINPITGNVLVMPFVNSNIEFGAMFTDGETGEVYGNSNESNAFFYRFDKVTGKGTKLSASISADGNDGAHNVNSAVPFAAELTITNTDNKNIYIPGTTNTYTVQVSNAGPFKAVQAKVENLIPTGIPAANVSYTAVATSGSTTSVINTLTGGIDDTIDLLKNGTITYTVTVLIPLAYTGNLVSTATATVSASNTEANTNDNTATDTDTKCAEPLISSQPLALQNLVLNTTPAALTVVASGISLEYRWYSNTLNSTTGGTLISSATTATYLPSTATLGIKYYYVVVSSPCGKVTSSISQVRVDTAPCNLPGVIDLTAGSTLDSQVGISALKRSGAQSTWPMVRKSAWIVLEAKTKGFVINRIKFNGNNLPVAADGTTLVIPFPVEGMLVYDTTNDCLKVYTTTNGVDFAWFCMTTQACPE